MQIHIGPSVTKFEIKPELGVRVNKISNLQNDIKMGLAAKDIRIEAPIPGKAKCWNLKFQMLKRQVYR